MGRGMGAVPGAMMVLSWPKTFSARKKYKRKYSYYGRGERRRGREWSLRSFYAVFSRTYFVSFTVRSTYRFINTKQTTFFSNVLSVKFVNSRTDMNRWFFKTLTFSGMRGGGRRFNKYKNYRTPLALVMRTTTTAVCERGITVLFPIVFETNYFTYRIVHEQSVLKEKKSSKLKLITRNKNCPIIIIALHSPWNITCYCLIIFPYRVARIFPARARNKCTIHVC